MGRDRVDGCKPILGAEGLTIGQDERTSGTSQTAFLAGTAGPAVALTRHHQSVGIGTLGLAYPLDP